MRVSEAAELDSNRVSGALSASPTGKAGRALYGLKLLSPLLPSSLYSFSVMVIYNIQGILLMTQHSLQFGAFGRGRY